MKRLSIFFSISLIVICGWWSQSIFQEVMSSSSVGNGDAFINVALAQDPATPTDPTRDPLYTKEFSNDEKRAGVWRDGMAIDWDYPLFDFGMIAVRGDTYSRGHKPTQPINFSHVIHVQKNHMECTYCHSGVAKSAYATIPSVELCMGCHKLVKTDAPEIKKLREYYEKKQPIEWVPVHNLPEHAHFNHERHVKSGVGCQNCHGQVQNMQVVEQVSSLKMGFCVSCHRDKGVSIDCAVCHY
jgi:hypothetical protein